MKNINCLQCIVFCILLTASAAMGKAGTPFIATATDSLPSDFAPVTILKTDNPAPGVMLFPTSGKGFGSYLVMMDTSGQIIKYKKTPASISNFSVQPNGMIAYNQNIKNFFKAWSDARIYIADNSLNVIDSITGSNGFTPAPHTSAILPNGHYLYSSYEGHNINMADVVSGGNPNALVAGAVLVEMDIDKNIVFQWRSWDHIPVNETYQPINDFLNVTTLYSNFNSVDVDQNGNFLLSNRLLSEVSKIDRNTGNFIWRLGGKNNEFTFFNEESENAPYYFSLQHDIRLYPNGNITLFDNGDQHPVQASKGLEYKLDGINKTATLVWDYKPETKIFAGSNGSTQRLQNGNYLIGWGNLTSDKKRDATEVDSLGNVKFETALPSGVISFKTLKFPYPIGAASAKVQKNEVGQDNTYIFEKGDQKTGLTLQCLFLDAFMYNAIEVTKYNYAPVYPRFDMPTPIILPYRFTIRLNNIDSLYAEIRIKTSDLEWAKNPDKLKIFVRTTIGQGYFELLNTSYDNTTMELVTRTSKMGEFILGYMFEPELPIPPVLVSPADQARINIQQNNRIVWAPQGYFRGSHYQVSDKNDFSNIVFEDTVLSKNSFNLSNLELNKTYYWKVRIYNEAGYGDWSPVWTFTPSESFVKIKSPNGGEIIEKDTLRHIFTWEHNISDSVRVELYKNGEFYLLLKDSLYSPIGAYAWKIPVSVPEDSSYQIKVTSIKNPALNDISDGYFKIQSPATDISETATSDVTDILISPNPAGEKTTIKFNVKDYSAVKIELVSETGQTLENIFSGYCPTGKYEMNLPTFRYSSGIYFIRSFIGAEQKLNKMVIEK